MTRHTYIQTHTRTCTHTHTHTNTHTHTYIQTHTHTQTYIHTYIHTHTYIHAHTCKHTTDNIILKYLILSNLIYSTSDCWVSEDETVNIREGSIVRLRIIGLVIDAGVIVSRVSHFHSAILFHFIAPIFQFYSAFLFHCICHCITCDQVFFFVITDPASMVKQIDSFK